MVTAAMEKTVGGLLLESKPIHRLEEEEKNRVLLEVICAKGLKMLGWNEECAALQSRVQSLRRWRKDEPWPDLSAEHLLVTLDQWLTPFLTSLYKQTELEKLDLPTILLSILSWNLQTRLETLAPTTLAVPSGSRISIQYFTDDKPPVMEVRLQEMFGLLETPTVNEGRTKILLHLLSPGYKPVQVTQDLRSFWQTTYHDVRKELRMRYPKHSWPEDPWTAIAVRGAKRKTQS
jgi:ATP-dependent helicase HrpB